MEETAVKLSDLNRLNRSDVSDEQLDAAVKDLFSYHPWDEEQINRGAFVKEKLAEAYKALILHVPSCPSRTRALNALTDARMLANAAISFNGQV